MQHTTPVPQAKQAHFSAWLKNTRKAKKVSLATLAQAAGISATAVSHHCEGINFPHERHSHIIPAYEQVLGENWVCPPFAATAPVSPTPKPADISFADPAMLAALLAAVATGQFEIVIRSRT